MQHSPKGDTMKYKIGMILTFSACCLISSACSDGTLETAPVKGTVTIDGKPLPHGTVMFVPSKGRAARGEIQADGSFELSTYSEGDGAIVDEHRVSVSCVEQHLDSPAGASESTDAGTFMLSRSLIPKHYSDSSRSGLTFQVERNTDNFTRIELSSTARPLAGP